MSIYVSYSIIFRIAYLTNNTLADPKMDSSWYQFDRNINAYEIDLTIP